MRIIKKILKGTLDGNVFKRILFLFISFLAIFYITLIISYLLLPEGFLRGKHPVVNMLELSPNVWISTLQIILYNLVFIVILILSSLIAEKSKILSNKYVPVSYITFWGLMLLLGIIMGTWSFELSRPPETFIQRLLCTFDIYHHSGLLEILAYLFITSVSYKFTLWYSDGKKILSSRKLWEIQLSKNEKIILACAFFLLFLSAFIESYWIGQYP